MRILLLIALLVSATVGAADMTTSSSLEPRSLISTLAGLRTAYQASPDHGEGSTKALMACVGLCIAGHPADLATLGPWRATARSIVKDRIAYRQGKPAATWAEAMPELWVGVLEGRFEEVRNAQAKWPEAKTDPMGCVLMAFATRDSAGLGELEGPWVRMARQWCGHVQVVPATDRAVDPLLVVSAETNYGYVYNYRDVLNGWVADVAFMLRSIELTDVEAVTLLQRIAGGLTITAPAAKREALIQQIEAGCQRADVTNVATISACLDAIDRCLQGSRGMTAKPGKLVGLGDIAQWLADRSRRAIYFGARQKGYLSDDNPLAPLVDTHGNWLGVARLAFDFVGEPRRPDAVDILLKAVEGELLKQRHSTGFHLLQPLWLAGQDAHVSDVIQRVLATCDPDDPALMTGCLPELGDGPHLGLFRERLAQAVARGDRSLPTVWYAGCLNPGPLLTLGERKPDATWIDAVVDNTTLPWPKFGAETRFVIVWRGALAVPSDGVYELATESDDGSRLRLSDGIAVSNTGSHGMEIRSRFFRLKAGPLPLELEFEQGEGGAGCRLLWRIPGTDKLSVVPADRLSHGQDRTPGLEASGYRAADPDSFWKLRQPTLSPVLLTAAADRPFDAVLQREVCRRAVILRNEPMGLDAARRVGDLAIKKLYPYHARNNLGTGPLADTAIHIMASNCMGPSEDNDRILALAPFKASLDHFALGSCVQKPESLYDEHRFYGGAMPFLRRNMFWGLFRAQLFTDPRFAKALAAADIAGPTDLHVHEFAAMADGEFLDAQRMHVQRRMTKNTSLLSADERCESIIEQAVLGRMLNGRDPEPAALDQALAANDNVEVYVQAALWITGRISWAEFDASSETIKDGGAALYLRGLYLLTIGQEKDAKSVIEAFMAKYPTWSEIPKCTGILKACADRLGQPDRLKAKALPRDAETATKPASDF